MLACQPIGNPSNPPLVILHGFMGSHKDFEEVSQALASHYYVLALDLPAHGESYSINPQSLQSTLFLIHQTLKPWTDRPLTLLGYSLGGRIASVYQIFFPKQVSKLILISSAPPLLSFEEKIKRFKQDLKTYHSLYQDSLENFLTRWYQQPLFHTLTSTTIELLIKNRLYLNPQKLAKALLVYSPAFFPSRFPSCPLHYFVGAKDFKYQKLCQGFTKSIQEVKITSISMASHAIHLEQPTTLINHLLNKEEAHDPYSIHNFMANS